MLLKLCCKNILCAFSSPPTRHCSCTVNFNHYVQDKWDTIYKEGLCTTKVMQTACHRLLDQTLIALKLIKPTYLLTRTGQTF
uniref:Uncharacterized protein n=1 Tax=Ixodes ricinus TaxID=34613 RepID=A0A0K8R859_IXORI